jgi:hypothetical protein
MADKPDSKMTNALVKALNFAYDAALAGVPGVRGVPIFESVDTLADDYLGKSRDAEAAIAKLIKFQATKASVAGAVTGLGGALTLAVTLPVNLVSVLAIQLRMVAAIARLRGYDVHSDQVRSLAFVCLVGDSVWEPIKGAGISLAVTLAKRKMVNKLPGKALLALNKAVGFRLATKAGSKGIANFSRLVPIVGGVVGGALDGGATLLIASRAKDTFTLPKTPKPKQLKTAAKKKAAKKATGVRRAPRQKAA